VFFVYFVVYCFLKKRWIYFPEEKLPEPARERALPKLDLARGFGVARLLLNAPGLMPAAL